MNLTFFHIFSWKKTYFGQISSFHVFTLSFKRIGYFFKKIKRSFLSKSNQKLMKGQTSKIGFLKGLLIKSRKTLLKIKYAEGFEWNGESAPKGACKWIKGEAYSEFRHADPVKFRELVSSLGLDYEEGCWPTMYKLVGSRSAVLLMSPRQGETSQHRGMKCDMVDWVSRKCRCETAAWAAPLHE